MKIYFTAAIIQRDRLIEEYKLIIDTLTSLGHKCVTAYNVLTQPLSEVLLSDTKMQQEYFSKWQKIIRSADAAVVEVSFPSTVHIGAEIGALIERGKPTVCLYTSGRNPTFLNVPHSSKLIKLEYDKESVSEVLKWGLEEAERMMNRRFTFFVSPEIDDYLSKIFRQKGLSRSEYIRNLILKDMKRR